MFCRITFRHPFEDQPDAEAKVKRAAARVVASAAEMGVRARDISVGENLRIAQEGLLDLGQFIEMVYQHVDAIAEEVVH